MGVLDGCQGKMVGLLFLMRIEKTEALVSA
jgi:hypothetical protein